MIMGNVIDMYIDEGREQGQDSIFSLRAMMKEDGRLDEFDDALDRADRELLTKLAKEYGVE